MAIHESGVNPPHYIVTIPTQEVELFQCANQPKQPLVGTGAQQITCASFEEGRKLVVDFLLADINQKQDLLLLMILASEDELIEPQAH